MKCPYCGAEMKEGFITVLGIRNLYQAYGWYPKEAEKENSCLSEILNPAEKLPRGKGKMGRCCLDGYRCTACEKIIIDLKSDHA